jgi:hypothetical protein
LLRVRELPEDMEFNLGKRLVVTVGVVEFVVGPGSREAALTMGLKFDFVEDT